MSCLLLIGASVRAAAFSALRAGFAPICVDLFADLDLRQRCPATKLEGTYPDGFRTALAELPMAPWLYTGGLENYPDLIDDLARLRPLWGATGMTLRTIRAPEFLASMAGLAGLPSPALTRAWNNQKRWLVKPLASSAGFGISMWSARESKLVEGMYAQEYIEGTPVAALYAALVDRVEFLGMTRQLVGEAFLGAAPFRYAGSVGPVAPTLLRPAAWQGVVHLGEVVRHASGMVGVFGIDGIVKDGDFWPIEINPRYTASMEILEQANGLRVLAWHQRAFQPGPAPTSGATHGVVAKGILYARQNLVAPVLDQAELADIPHPGEFIAAGEPICTLFVRADSEAECLEQLRSRAAGLERCLYAEGCTSKEDHHAQ